MLSEALGAIQSSWSKDKRRRAFALVADINSRTVVPMRKGIPATDMQGMPQLS